MLHLVLRALKPLILAGTSVIGTTCWLLAFVAGCDPPVVRAMYGPPPVEHDPTVGIADFSYEPARTIEVGETLRFTATTNKPFSGYAGEIRVVVGDAQTAPLAGYDSPTLQLWLSDNGFPPDQTGADGVWTGEFTWLAEYGLQQNLPVSAHLRWTDGYVTESVSAPSLTVVATGDATP
jgi:hypothetical protein